MSKDIKNITEEIMVKIQKGQLKMRPKIYFILGSFLSGIGLAFLISFSIFLVSLIKFSIRSQRGMMAQYKLDQLLEGFPWWLALVSVLSLILGIWLIRKYDFSYKIKPWTLIIIFMMTVIMSGWFVDLLGLNEVLLRRGSMRGIMKGVISEEVSAHQFSSFVIIEK